LPTFDFEKVANTNINLDVYLKMLVIIIN